MKLEYISSKTLNFDYLNRKSVSLSLVDVDVVVNSLIFYIDDKEIGLSVPNHDFFKKGISCNIEVLYKEHILKITSEIIRFEDGILYFNMPKKVTIIQQRNSLRVGCNIKCDIERFATGKIKNISCGGCYIALDEPTDLSSFNLEHIKICFSINNYDYRLDCRVVEITDKYVRVEFNNLSTETKDNLFLFCHSTDSENFKRIKNAR